MTVLIEALFAETLLFRGQSQMLSCGVRETKLCETSYFVDTIRGWNLFVDRRYTGYGRGILGKFCLTALKSKSSGSSDKQCLDV
jgi:hypothetical protein